MNSRIVLGVVLALVSAGQQPASYAQTPEQAVRLVIQDSPLAGFNYHHAVELWTRMAVGDRLELVREPDNPHDPDAVRVEWRGQVLGYVPRRENAALAWGMDHGIQFRARIVRREEHPNPARRIAFEVFVE